MEFRWRLWPADQGGADDSAERRTDFTQTDYDVKVDFTNAGTGTYSTNLVIEYVLSP